MLARRVDDAPLFIGTLARDVSIAEPVPRHPPLLRVGIVRTPHWDRAGADGVPRWRRRARALRGLGVTVEDVGLPVACHGLTEAQMDIMAASRPSPRLHRKRVTGAAEFSAAFARQLEAGRAVIG